MAFLSINPNLLLIKLILFLSYGGMTSIWPFLSLHMLHLGLTLEHIAICNMVMPLVSSFGAPFAGLLADKTGRHKLIIIICIVISTVAFNLLLIVPTAKPLPPVCPTIQFVCSEEGASLMTKNRFESSCHESTENRNGIQFDQCSIYCSLKNNSEVKVNGYPYLCSRSSENTVCSVFNATGKGSALGLAAHLKLNMTGKDDCLYDLVNPTLGDYNAESLFCRQHDNCRVVCEVSIKNGTFDYKQCNEAGSSVLLTFGIYLLLRCIGETVNAALFPLLDAMTLAMSQEHGGHYGRQYLFGVVSSAVFSPIAGILIDYSSKQKGSLDYSPAFYLCSCLMTCFALLVLVVKCRFTHRATQWLKGVNKLFKNPIICTLFVSVTLIGTLWGYLETFLYVFLDTIGATKTLIGVCQLMSVLPALPLLYFSHFIVEKVQHPNWLVIAFVFYALRLAGYSFLTNPWWSLLLEATKGFCLFIPKVAFSIYANQMSPPELTSTVQSLVVILHFNFGRIFGSLFGGYLFESVGARMTFQLAAVMAGVGSCMYFAIHHFKLKEMESRYRRKTEPQPYKEVIGPEPVVMEPLMNGQVTQIDPNHNNT